MLTSWEYVVGSTHLRLTINTAKVKNEPPGILQQDQDVCRLQHVRIRHAIAGVYFTYIKSLK